MEIIRFSKVVPNVRNARAGLCMYTNSLAWRIILGLILG